MKTISSAIFYMSEWQAIFQCEEYSFCEARHIKISRRI